MLIVLLYVEMYTSLLLLVLDGASTLGCKRIIITTESIAANVSVSRNQARLRLFVLSHTPAVSEGVRATERCRVLSVSCMTCV